MTPVLSAMKAVPSGAKATAVGSLRLPIAIVSWKPVGTSGDAAARRLTPGRPPRRWRRAHAVRVQGGDAEVVVRTCPERATACSLDRAPPRTCGCSRGGGGSAHCARYESMHAERRLTSPGPQGKRVSGAAVDRLQVDRGGRRSRSGGPGGRRRTSRRTRQRWPFGSAPGRGEPDLGADLEVLPEAPFRLLAVDLEGQPAGADLDPELAFAARYVAVSVFFCSARRPRGRVALGPTTAGTCR